MCDEYDDVFADELLAEGPQDPWALDRWNKNQKPWAPVRRWHQLTPNEKMAVWELHRTMVRTVDFLRR